MPTERVEELSRREIERQIQELRKDKVRIDDNLRKMQVAQARIFGEKQRETEDPTEEERKRKRESEAANGTSAEKKKERRETDDGSDDEKEKGDDDKENEEKDKEKDKDEDDDKKEDGDDKKERRRSDKSGRPKQSDPRSRNLFGKLLGHLHSAKSKLEMEKSAKSTELRQQASQRLEEKLNTSKMNIKEFRKHSFEQQIKDEAVKSQELFKIIQEKELLLLQRRLESHYSLMMNFIKTEAQPTIFYLPSRHSRDTEQKLEDTRATIKHKIASLKVQLQQTETHEDPEDAMRRQAAAAAVAASEAPKKERGSTGAKPEGEEDSELESQPRAAKKRKTEENGNKGDGNTAEGDARKDATEEKAEKKEEKQADSDSDN